MKTTMMFISAAAAMALALPASAQVLGGQLGGGVSGNVGGQAGLPSTQPLTGAVGQSIRDAGQATRDTVRDTTSLIQNATPDVQADAQLQTGVDASAHDGHAQASSDLSIDAGAEVRATDGAVLGQVVRTTRDAAGRVETLVVRSADGALKAVPASGASVQGEAVVTGWSQAQFDAAPAAE